MIKLGLELYAALCAFATIAFLALALATRRKGIFDDLESMKELDQLVADRSCAFRFPDRLCERRCWWACQIISRSQLTVRNSIQNFSFLAGPSWECRMLGPGRDLAQTWG